MTNAEDHDALTKLCKDVEYIRNTVDEIKEGKTKVCVVHKQRLDNHWTHIKAQWWLWGVLLAAIVGAVVRIAVT